VDMDALEVPLHGQCGARPSQSRVFLSHHLPQAGAQVIQLLMESSAELLQEGGVPGSRGALCVEEVEAMLEHLVEHREGLGLLELATTLLLLREAEVYPTLEDGAWLEKTEAAAVVHELLQLTFRLFSTTGSSAGRDESLLDRFLAGLDQQLEEVDMSLREGRTTEHSPLGSENSRLAGKSYFQQISVYLKEKEYSRCAWEVVSVEIRRSLLLANKLIGKLRK
ncbi:hypothetical protein Celaphus_00018254, partial [Cervus elaphus hippelaphus]